MKKYYFLNFFYVGLLNFCSSQRCLMLYQTQNAEVSQQIICVDYFIRGVENVLNHHFIYST